MIGVCLDVTERRLVEEQTRRAKEAAEETNRVRSQFLANVSHELRTPMNSILGMLQLSLDDGGKLSPELRDWLETAKASADSLLVLLNDVLDFSRLESGQLRVAAQPFHLREKVETTVRLLAPKAFDKRVELVCDIQDDVPDALVGDAERLRQVLTNLVSNAVKFTDQGEIVVQVRVEAQSPDHVRLCFGVTDTGVGIAPHDQDRIFLPFAQADASASRQHGGVGLGLSIAQELIRRMGGQLSLESKLGQGSRFWFSLDFELRPSDAATPLAAARQGLRDHSVLIVEDNTTNRGVLQKLLSTWALRTDSAIDADHALGKLHRAAEEGRQVSFVLADGEMPGLDGLDLAARIAEDFDDPPPVVLMLSASEKQARRARLAAAPIAACLEKPVTPSALLDTAVTVLGITSLPESADHPRLAAGCPPLSILLAEDTPANQKVMTTLLARFGHATDVAANGQEAVDLFSRGDYDLVLMDVQMPRVDGFQATAEIRKIDQLRGAHTPIIAMTAHVMTGDRERCLEAGMDEYLAKPIDVHLLADTLSRFGSRDAGRRGGERHHDEDAPRAENRGAKKRHSEKGRTEDRPAEERHAAKRRTNRDGRPRPDSSANGDGECPAIDKAAALARLGGDEELYQRLVEFFLEDAPRLLEELRRAIGQSAAPAVERAAHSLKGLAANLGAAGVVTEAQSVEQFGHAGDLSSATAGTDKLERQVEQLLHALRQQLPAAAGSRE
jgi:CheY-like chemotaxis protein